MSLTDEEKKEIKQSFDFVISYFKDVTAQQYFFESKNVTLACILKMRISPASRLIPLFGPKNHKQPVWPSTEAQQAFENFCQQLTKLNNYYMQANPCYQKLFQNKANEHDIKEAVALIEQLIQNHRQALMENISNPDSELHLANDGIVSYGQLIVRFNSLYAPIVQTKAIAQDFKISPFYNTSTISHSLAPSSIKI